MLTVLVLTRALYIYMGLNYRLGGLYILTIGHREFNFLQRVCTGYEYSYRDTYMHALIMDSEVCGLYIRLIMYITKIGNV